MLKRFFLKLLIAISLIVSINVAIAGSLDPAPQYKFYRDQVGLGFYDNHFLSFDATKYVSYPYVPIFWNGAVVVTSGFIFSYQHMFYHTTKTFSLSYGVSGSRWVAEDKSFYTASVYLAMQLWFLRTTHTRSYFIYSIAGPSFISRYHFGNDDTGGYFTFQDFLGFGTQLGNKHPIDISLRLVHYSNGNLLPDNPGIKVPVVINLAYVF